ncbi:flagellar hook-associated protein FlgL [Pseudoalteromonas tunicata]|uniref:flagellar hook-associated protein FlgL n=1 Tax=Pseudoalteromonas tunicata TaxID=314281 RepID=UPI00273DAD52|nr:flagellar hook-associated protein FlgL [Pseudoalteromonas tunicata]MDP4982912.1 flagellar hook-associated protein FlgL [Pseudoalteromonas tunicata]MDP5212467.1 flagellar hook-associated protein FlgL [Pseudoalteromonas tunicata]
MRIGTANFYQRSLASLQSRQVSLDRAQEELSSGKKVIRPSDDPVASNSIIKLKKELDVSSRYLDAQSTANRYNREAETSLTSMNNILLRLQESLSGAINGALDNDGLIAYREQIASRYEEYEGIVNQKNANGDYMFSGFQTRTKPYQSDSFGYFDYQGDSGQRQVLIAPSFDVAVTEPGNSFASNVASKFSHYRPASAAASGAQVSLGFVTDGAEYRAPTAPANTYQIQFSGAVPPQADTWQVVDVSLPAPNVVNGPYGYSPGDEIEFQGISVKTDVNNPPQAGDVFDMQPDKKADETSVLWMFQQAIDAMSITGTGYTAKPLAASTVSIAGGNIKFPDEHKFADFEVVFPSAGQVEVREVDRSTTPPTVLATPVSAQAYNPAGTLLEFNGIEITVAGAAGNQTTIPPAPAPNFPETIRLDRPENNRRADVLGALLEEVTNAQTNIDNTRSQIGARMNSISNEGDAQLLFKETTKITLADLEEIDVYEAVTNLENSRVGLQAAQQAFARVQNLSLFDYI